MISHTCVHGFRKVESSENPHKGWELNPSPEADDKEHFTIDNYLYQSSYLMVPRFEKSSKLVGSCWHFSGLVKHCLD